MLDKAPNLHSLDGLILANRFADQAIFANHLRVPKMNFFFAISFGAQKIANRRFEAIRAIRSNGMNIGFLLRIDSREALRFALRIAGPSN